MICMVLASMKYAQKNQWGDVTISELGLRACDSYKLFILRV